MSNSNRLGDYIGHIDQAARDALAFVDAMSKDQFLTDKRTQQAVVMSLLIIGEAATKVMDSAPDFVVRHSAVPWRAMRGMRNRIAHGYFEVNQEVVWETVKTALPDLLARLPAAIADAG